MVLSMVRWQNKVAIVTGASSGMGAAITEALVEAGMKVVGLARRQERLDQLAVKLEKKKGKLYPFKADITKENDILEAFAWVTKNLGPVHVLVNNAGISINESLIEGKTETWRNVLDTNVLGLSIATREAVKIMREKCVDGHIIHINSILGHQALPLPKMNMYVAAKYGVTALTEVLRQELNSIGSKIKITSVSPGLTGTEIWEASGLTADKAVMEALKTTPMLKPEDIADAVVYAISTPPHVQVHELTIKPLGERL